MGLGLTRNFGWKIVSNSMIILDRMCISCVGPLYTSLKDGSRYDLRVQSISLIGFQKKLG